MAGVPSTGGNTLRAALKAKGWSYSRLAAELRRRATREAVTVPKHESLVTLITRWVNNRQQPDDFYRGLLSRTLGLPEGELFEEALRAADLAAGAEPWLLASALDVSAVGGRSLDLLEAAVADFARRYPSAAPAELLGPVREHYRDAVVAGQPATHRAPSAPVRRSRRAGRPGRQPLVRPAGPGQGRRLLPGRPPGGRGGRGGRDLGAWALATWSLMPTYNGDHAEALRLIQVA
jgi:transcriptional regulator with XRE-family HTH domain